jgi:hypothetical protein
MIQEEMQCCSGLPADHRGHLIKQQQAEEQARIEALARLTEQLDPWVHRSEKMRCKTCMWFAPKKGNNGIVDLGRCRRHAPSMNGYPVVFVNDWCGDHKLNENAMR